MLTIRMQRTGRKGLAHFRVVVQDSRFAPNSGRVVAQLGHHNPHTKETVINEVKATEYLKNGAQPSPRVVRLLQNEKIGMPDWVNTNASSIKRKTRNLEKLRKNQPKEESPAETSDANTEEVSAEEVQNEPVAEEKVTDGVEAETPAEKPTEPDETDNEKA